MQVRGAIQDTTGHEDGHIARDDAYPTFRAKRSHEGRFWFSRSNVHVHCESHFEMVVVMLLDFRGQVSAVSANPVWLLWPKGTRPARHAPDLFARLRDGSTLLVDVKRRERLRPKDDAQHRYTRAICDELGWRYHVFTDVDPTVQRNVTVLAGYRHPRFAPSDAVAAAVATVTPPALGASVTLAELIAEVSERTDDHPSLVLAGVYHLMWQHRVHADLNLPLAMRSAVWR